MIEPAYRFGSLLGSAGPEWEFDALELHVDGTRFEGGVIVEQGRPANRRFKARVPTECFDDAAHSFAIVGGDGPVTREITVDAASLRADRHDSHAVVAGGLRIEGWVQDAADPGRVVTLVAAIDDDPFHTFEPDEARRPIAALYGGQEVCGFALDVPEGLVEDRERTLTLQTDDGQLLRGFPRTVSLEIAIENSLVTIGRVRERIAERWELHAPGASA